MKLTHPQSKQTVEVPSGSQQPYLRNGWVEKPAKAKKKAARNSGARAAGVTTDTTPGRG